MPDHVVEDPARAPGADPPRRRREQEAVPATARGPVPDVPARLVALAAAGASNQTLLLAAQQLSDEGRGGGVSPVEFGDEDIDELVGRLDRPETLAPPAFAAAYPGAMERYTDAEGAQRLRPLRPGTPLERREGLIDVELRTQSADPTRIAHHENAYFQGIREVRDVDAFPTGPAPVAGVPGTMSVPRTDLQVVTGAAPAPVQGRSVVSSDVSGRVEARVHSANPRAPEGSHSRDHPVALITTPDRPFPVTDASGTARRDPSTGQPLVHAEPVPDVAAGEQARMRPLPGVQPATTGRYRTAEGDWVRLPSAAQQAAHAQGQPLPPGVATEEQSASVHYPLFDRPPPAGGPSPAGGPALPAALASEPPEPAATSPAPAESVAAAPAVAAAAAPATSAARPDQHPATAPATGRASVREDLRTTPLGERARVEVGRDTVTPGEHGPTTARVQAGVELDRAGARVSGGRNRTSTGGDGVPVEVSHAGSLDAEGRVGYQYERHRGPEGARDTTTAGASVGLGDTGVEGMTVTASRSTPSGRSVSFSIGYTVDIAQPVAEPNGTIVVSGKLTATVGGEFGGQSRGQRARIGGSVGLALGQERRFRESFATREEAQAFYEDNTKLFGLVQPLAFAGPDDAGVSALAVGGSLGQTDTAGVKGTATVGTLFLQGSLTIGLAGTAAMDVERVSDTEVRVTVRSTAGYDVAGGLSTLGVGFGFGGGSAEISGATLTYHLPEGRAALEDLLRTERPPEGLRGPGWEVSERILRGTEETDSRSVSVGVGVTSTGTTTVEHVVDAEGRQSVRVRGQRAGTAAPAGPGWVSEMMGWTSSRSVRIESSSGSGANLRFEVDGSSAVGSHEMLSEAIGEGRQADVGGDDAGRWILTTRLSEEQFRDLVRQVVQGSREARNAEAWLLGHADRGRDLRAELTTASSLDEGRERIAEFVSDLGFRGASYIRRIVGELDWDVRLEGSTTFQGEEGRRTARAELERLTGRAAAGEDVVAAIETLLANERRRLARMSQEAVELPPALRSSQIQRQEAVVDEVRGVLAEAQGQQLVRGRRSTAEEAAQWSGELAERQALETGAGPVSSVETHEAATAAVATERARRRRARAALDADVERMDDADRHQGQLRGPLVHERSLNEHGIGGGYGAVAPREVLVWFGALGEASTYEAIDARWELAERARNEAERLREEAMDAYAAVRDADPESPVTAALVAQARERAWAATREFRGAQRLWEQLEVDFRGLRERHSGYRDFRIVPFGIDRRTFHR